MNHWNLPGPANFVEELVGSFRSGASTVVLFPGHAPTGLLKQVQRVVKDRDEDFRIRETDPEEPLEAVAKLLDLNRDDSSLKSPESLAISMRLRGKLVWVSDVEEKAWDCWYRFLTRFVRTSNANSSGDCGQFCLLLSSSVKISGEFDVPGLQLVRWKGVVGRIDAIICASSTSPNRGRQSFERVLREALAMGMASYDLPYVDTLINMPLQTLLDPFELLAEEARRRGWSGPIDGDGWATGRQDEWEGRMHEHSASLVVAGKKDDVIRRIWEAELAVVFPKIEDSRIDIIRRLRGSLSPMQTLFDYIDKVEDLEVAHILHQVRSNRIGTQWESRLKHMNELRKALAHLEPVKYDNLVGAGLLS